MSEREEFLEWLDEEIYSPRFTQVAAQVLFQCSGCCECCRGEGYSLVDREDIRRIAHSLGLDEAVAIAKFTDPDPEGRAGCRTLKSTGPQRCCCFLDPGSHRCRIYEDRPGVCRTFPMMSPDPECSEPICLYSDCLGAAGFVDLINKAARDPELQSKINRLGKDPERLELLMLRLFIWKEQLLGRKDEAERISSMMGLKLPSFDAEFKRDCLAYLLLTVNPDGLEDYRFEG